MELRVRPKELRAAPRAPVDAGLLGVGVRAGERALGRRPAQNGVLLGREARLSLLVGELDLPGHGQTTTSETATNCDAAAATTSAWKISWKPRVSGNGFGHFVA